MDRARLPLTMLFAALACGCVTMDVGVSNPIPAVRKVAIAPFINLSTEPDVDVGRQTLFAGGYADRRFAQAYYAELQKVPGFEVIPVGVVDQAIHGLKLPMDGPADYLAVCEAIGADAICIGAVTDFDAYQPRLGMQVQWFALEDAAPPAATMPYEREHAREMYKQPKSRGGWMGRLWPFGDDGDAAATVCGQSPDGGVPVPWSAAFDEEADAAFDNGETFRPTRVAQALPPVVELPAPPIGDASAILPGGPQNAARPLAQPAREPDPLYSYTRIFDGRDARLTARLRDYVELSGDLRAGGWENYLTRSEDFIRFCSHVMIVEMLQLHGGESSRRVILKKRHQR